MLTKDDINGGLRLFGDGGFDSVFSAYKEHWIPRWSIDGEPYQWDINDRPMRQDVPERFVENGAFYITKRNILENYKCRLGGKTGIFEMPSETSFELDEESDWLIVEALLIKNRKKNIHDLIKNVKMLVMDVDGVLTDAFVYCDVNGKELKRFSVRDGMGLQMIREIGVKTAIITKEKTSIIDFRAKKLKIDYLYKGIENKINALKEISEKSGINFKEIAYIGDDINDTGALKAAGFSAVPGNAEAPLLNIADYICLNDGGKGCVREICNILLEFNSHF